MNKSLERIKKARLSEKVGWVRDGGIWLSVWLTATGISHLCHWGIQAETKACSLSVCGCCLFLYLQESAAKEASYKRSCTLARTHVFYPPKPTRRPSHQIWVKFHGAALLKREKRQEHWKLDRTAVCCWILRVSHWAAVTAGETCQTNTPAKQTQHGLCLDLLQSFKRCVAVCHITG